MTIKELREEKGLSQKAFAESIGMKTPTIGGYENGRIKPSEAVLAKIKEVYGVDVAKPAEQASPAEGVKSTAPAAPAKRTRKKATPTVVEEAGSAPVPVEEAKLKKRGGRKKATPVVEEKVEDVPVIEEAVEQPAAAEEKKPAPKKGGRKKAALASEATPAVEEKQSKKKGGRKKTAPVVEETAPSVAEEAKPKKRGGRKKAAPVVEEVVEQPAEQPVAAEEKKPAPKKPTKSGKKASPAVEEAKPVEEKKPRGKKKAEAAPKKAGVTVVIQSPMGGSITPEEIIKKTGPVDAVYVRVDENKAYWVRGDETGSVDLW